MNKYSFYNSLLDSLKCGEIVITEPNLTKVLVKCLNDNFGNIKSSPKLTQSNKKWMASRFDTSKVECPMCEIGDFLLILKRGNEYKYSFIQAKLIKNINSRLQTFRGTVNQHYVMSGISKEIYLMGRTPFTRINKSTHVSITNYLVFYRKFSNGVCLYDAFLTSVKKNCNCEDKSKIIFDNFCKSKVVKSDDYKQSLTIKRDKKEKTICLGFNDQDTLAAKNFDSIIKAIKNFSIGDILDPEAFYAFEPYLDTKIKRELVEKNNFRGEIDVMDEDNCLPTVLIDVTEYGIDSLEELIDDLQKIY